MKFDKIGKEVRKGRKKKKINQEELAEMVNSSQNAISRIEKGKITDWELLEKIYETLELDFAYIIEARDRAVKILDEIDDITSDMIDVIKRDRKAKKIKQILKLLIVISTLYLAASLAVQAYTGKSVFRIIQEIDGMIQLRVVKYVERDGTMYDLPEKTNPSGYQDADISESALVPEAALENLVAVFRGNIHLPVWMPEGYKFDSVDILPHSEDGFNSAIVTYNSDGDYIKFEVSEISEGVDGYFLFNEKRKEQSVLISNNYVTLYLSKVDGVKTAYMVLNYVTYRISYSCTDKDIIKVMESLAYLNIQDKLYPILIDEE